MLCSFSTYLLFLVLYYCFEKEKKLEIICFRCSLYFYYILFNLKGAAWCRIHPEHTVQARGLLVGDRDSAAQLVASAQYCSHPALRLLSNPNPGDKDLPGLLLDFLVGKFWVQSFEIFGGKILS